MVSPQSSIRRCTAVELAFVIGGERDRGYDVVRDAGTEMGVPPVLILPQSK